MEDRQLDIETNLVDVGPESWREQIRQISMANGFFEELGNDHYAGFLEAGNNLFVTFENAQRVRETAYDAEPRGYAYARHDGWSHLALFSKGVSWFRDEAIYQFFDRLMDDGFFDDFDHVPLDSRRARGSRGQCPQRQVQVQLLRRYLRHRHLVAPAGVRGHGRRRPTRCTGVADRRVLRAPAPRV